MRIQDNEDLFEMEVVLFSLKDVCCSMVNVGKAEFSYPYGVPGCHGDPVVDANVPFHLWEQRLKHLTKELIGGHVDHFD